MHKTAKFSNMLAAVRLRSNSPSKVETGGGTLSRLCAIFLLAFSMGGPASAQSALEAASALGANAQGAFLGAEVGLSGADIVTVLEEAAAAGDPLAMWRLGIMYESGAGVAKDPVKAFGYFSKIANENANTGPRSIEADIVAQSFVKIGDYYRVGLPDAGIVANERQSRDLLYHAASYFGDPQAQYRLGLLLLDDEDGNALQGARWLSLSAHKGHIEAQAVLGDLLFNGERIQQKQVEGLMWLTLAHEGTRGSQDQLWVSELLNRAVSIASPDQRRQAIEAANSVRSQLMPN